MQRKMKGSPSVYAHIDFSNIHNIEMLIYPETQETSCLAKKKPEAWVAIQIKQLRQDLMDLVVY